MVRHVERRLTSLPWRRLAPVLLFGLALLVFSVSGVSQRADSEYSMLLSESLVKHRTFALDRYAIPRYAPTQHEGGYVANGPIYQLEIARGHLYYYFPPGSSVLSAPFVVAFNAAGVSAARSDGSYDRSGAETIERWIAAVLMAALATTFFFTARLLLPTPLSLGIALVGAFGTQVYSTASRALWSDTWGALLIGVVAFLLLRHETGRGRLEPVLLATLLAWSFFVRPTFAAHIVAITIYVLVFQRSIFVRYAVAGAIWLIGFVAYSWTHFHQFLPSYYRATRLEFESFWVGLAGNLVSPSRGVFVYVPTLFFVGYLLLRHRRQLQCPRLVALALAIVAGHVVTVAGYFYWWGGHSFGARMTTGLVPWFVVLAVIGLAAMSRSPSAGRRRVGVAFAAVLVCAAIFINTMGATSEASWRWNSQPTDVDRNTARLWDWSEPQFLAEYLGRPACYKRIDQFVVAFYRGGLQRQPHSRELARWSADLTRAQTRGRAELLAAARALGARVFDSLEYRRLDASDSEFVNDLYEAYLGRHADKAGYDGWIRALRSGTTRAEVREGFARSGEFQKNVTRLCAAGVAQPE